MLSEIVRTYKYMDIVYIHICTCAYKWHTYPLSARGGRTDGGRDGGRDVEREGKKQYIYTYMYTYSTGQWANGVLTPGSEGPVADPTIFLCAMSFS